MPRCHAEGETRWPAEPGQGDDLGVTNGSGLPWAARGRGLGGAEVRAIVVVVRDVLAEQAQQMTVVDRSGERTVPPDRRAMHCAATPIAPGSGLGRAYGR
jgi:hypothetical protein